MKNTRYKHNKLGIIVNVTGYANDCTEDDLKQKVLYVHEGEEKPVWCQDETTFLNKYTSL